MRNILIILMSGLHRLGKIIDNFFSVRNFLPLGPELLTILLKQAKAEVVPSSSSVRFKFLKFS